MRNGPPRKIVQPIWFPRVPLFGGFSHGDQEEHGDHFATCWFDRGMRHFHDPYPCSMASLIRESLKRFYEKPTPGSSLRGPHRTSFCFVSTTKQRFLQMCMGHLWDLERGCSSIERSEGQTAGFGPCFHLPGQPILEIRLFEPLPFTHRLFLCPLPAALGTRGNVQGVFGPALGS